MPPSNPSRCSAQDTPPVPRKIGALCIRPKCRVDPTNTFAVSRQPCHSSEQCADRPPWLRRFAVRFAQQPSQLPEVLLDQNEIWRIGYQNFRCGWHFSDLARAGHRRRSDPHAPEDQGMPSGGTHHGIVQKECRGIRRATHAAVPTRAGVRLGCDLTAALLRRAAGAGNLGSGKIIYDRCLLAMSTTVDVVTARH